jgi:DNA-binding transcriptional regulator YdaS (Cro superfamily)
MKALAASCGVRYQAIQQWRRRGRPPAERVLMIEEATGGQVTRYQLRPDIYPPKSAVA